MTTTPPSDLADELEALATYFEGWPHTSPRDLAASYGNTGFPADYIGTLMEAAKALRPSGTPLDEIQETPARNTDPATSHKAIHRLNATTSRGAVALAFYKSRVGYEEDGMTPKAAFKRAGITHHSSPWKRVSDLKNAGLIVPTGEHRVGDRGREVEVLVMTDFGVAEVERLMPTEAAEIRAKAMTVVAS